MLVSFLASSSILKMETTYFSETLVDVKQISIALKYFLKYKGEYRTWAYMRKITDFTTVKAHVVVFRFMIPSSLQVGCNTA
jgi:hypothetical protein